MVSRAGDYDSFNSANITEITDFHEVLQSVPAPKAMRALRRAGGLKFGWMELSNGVSNKFPGNSDFVL